MPKRLLSIPLTILAAIVVLLALSQGGAQATHTPGSTTVLNVAGEPVKIVRDDFGVPHIFAETDRGLFEAYGYVVAQDRLWQLELNRRAARGELAEVFGPGFLGADTAVRTVGYTEAELAAQFATLPLEEQARFQFYADGINRFIGELVVDPSFPFNLPLELLALSIIPPDPWTTTDSVAFGAFAIRRFGEIGGRELRNQALLDSLITAHGLEDGLAIFDDVRWVNDPDAPVTVPTRGRTEKEKPGRGKTSSGCPGPCSGSRAGGHGLAHQGDRRGAIDRGSGHDRRRVSHRPLSRRLRAYHLGSRAANGTPRHDGWRVARPARLCGRDGD